MKLFGLGIVSGIGAVLVAIVLAFRSIGLFAPASLPPPAFTPQLSLDLKLRFLRQHPQLDPRVLAIGSSIAWRQLDGEAFRTELVRTHQFFNGAAANLKIHQSRDLLEFYLASFHNVSTVLFLIGPPDFDSCSEEPAQLFDHDDAADYAFRGWPTSYFYLAYFAPARYMRAFAELEQAQVPFSGGMRLDKFGSSPILVPVSQRHGLRFGKIEIDPACIQSLVETSRSLTARGKQLVLVFAPLNPDYRATYPGIATQMHEIAKEIARQTSADRTMVLRLDDSPDFSPDDFYDAVHLEWPGAKRLSAMVSAALGMTAPKRISVRPRLRTPTPDGG